MVCEKALVHFPKIANLEADTNFKEVCIPRTFSDVHVFCQLECLVFGILGLFSDGCEGLFRVWIFYERN